MTTITTRPQYLNANTGIYTAWDLRSPFEGPPSGEGVTGYQDFRVVQRQAGANMSVDVGVTGAGLMRAWVRGDTREGQGLYLVDNIDRSAPTASTYVAQLNEVVTSNASGNPRLDQVILEVLDAQHTGASNVAQIRVVAGTPTAAATLDNRNGAASLPSSAVLLADVLIASGAVSVVTADVRDRRPWAVAAPPPTKTAVDMVQMIPIGLPITDAIAISHASHDISQLCYAAFLSRRIVSATRIRWKYVHGGTALTGNYVIGIYDASGRQIVTTGTVAFTGALNTYQVRSETISATTFDAGVYYVLFGLDSGAGGAGIQGVSGQTGTAANRAGTGAPNLLLGTAGGGGTTAPTTILALSDYNSLTSDISTVTPAPLIALSVG
jgi:hypothetical protein